MSEKGGLRKFVEKVWLWQDDQFGREFSPIGRLLTFLRLVFFEN
jgi:hypothetical protein